MEEKTDNKTIAKNTIFLYFRMMFTMLVSLYTSRVILQILGVDDFGIYQSVGGVVMMLSFLNGALSTGSSRFLTFELGRNDHDKLRRTFATVLNAHIILAIIIAVVAETGGLWFVYQKLVIPSDRLDAAVVAYHLSIVTAVFNITQVPYTASIISHERMGIYAYMSVVEAVLKLSIVYALNIGGFDKLKLYAILLCVVQVGIVLFYRAYCNRKFVETKFSFVWDKKILKSVLSYSGWNLFANTAIALKNQGATVMINIFFSPSVVSARAIANQVNMAANQFIQNFRTASNPQIVKKYAAGDFEGSKELLVTSTIISYYLMLVLCLPICLVTEDLLNIWLTEVPEYTVQFLQLTIITSLFQVFDTSFYTALYAKGQIRENALTSPTLGFIVFGLVYVMFRNGFSPLSLAWGLLIDYALLGLIIKPILIIKIVGYKLKDIIRVFIPCLKVTVVSVPVPLLVFLYQDVFFSSWVVRFFTLVLLSVVFVVAAVWFVGLDVSMREKISTAIRKKLGR